MPTFFFDVYDDDVALDEEGLELADLEAAKRAALQGARGLASEQVLNGYLDLRHRVEVRDETGASLATVSFRDAVAVEG